MSSKRTKLRRQAAQDERRRIEKLQDQREGQSERLFIIMGDEEERYSQLRAVLRPDPFNIRRTGLDSIMKMMIENELNIDSENHNHARIELLLAFSDFIFGPHKEAAEIIHNTLRIDVQRYPREVRWWTLGYERKSS
jgi:hypothetical protein